jgi:hypothetical protein
LQLRDYQAPLGKPFQHDDYLSELISMRDQLKAGLSSTVYQADSEEGPSSSEVAEKIKALKAANTIEATPQRVRQKQSTAEEPVTARIRRRTESSSAFQAVRQETASDPPPRASISDPPPASFVERIAETPSLDDSPILPPL